jgi:hypothetical protein
MSVSLVFSCGLAATVLVALVVVSYLNSPLRKQLHELCGSAERAEFWTAFANVTVVLTPAIFAMSVDPSSGRSVPPLLVVIGQVKWGFVGLVSSVLTMGWILGRFIRKFEMSALPVPLHKKVGGDM